MKTSTLPLLTAALLASAPLFASNLECTVLDKAHWTPPEELRAQLMADGNRVLDIAVDQNCYHVRMETADGRKVDGLYNPVGAYPIRRQVR